MQSQSLSATSTVPLQPQFPSRVVVTVAPPQPQFLSRVVVTVVPPQPQRAVEEGLMVRASFPQQPCLCHVLPAQSPQPLLLTQALFWQLPQPFRLAQVPFWQVLKFRLVQTLFWQEERAVSPLQQLLLFSFTVYPLIFFPIARENFEPSLMVSI